MISSLALWRAVLQAQPANNDFANAAVISGRSGSVAQTTAGATRQPGEPNHGLDAGGASVWYVWAAPASGAAEFDLRASEFNTTLGAYTGLTVNALTALAQNDDEFEYFPLTSGWRVRRTQSRIRFPAHAGSRYYIAVDGAGGLSGNITLRWNLAPPPANDNFSAAQIITGAEGFVSTHNVGATKEIGEPNHAGNPGSASIWYRWTAPVSGNTRIHTLNSLTSSGDALDTLLAIYTGNSLGALTLVASNDNNGLSLRSLVQFTATAGTTYQIAVDTRAASTNHGFVLLTWANGASANNNFANAQQLTGICGFVQGHNIFASKEAGEPTIAGNAGGASIWYTWTAPADGAAMFTTQGSPFFDTLLAVYTGSSLAGLTLVAENDDIVNGFLDGLRYSRVEFVATEGTTYRISVDGFKSATTNATGVSFLNWAFESATNDNFAEATAIFGTNGSVTGCNPFASKEVGEPSHGGNQGGQSMWYRWQAPISGVATIDLAGSLFDTLLAVYTADGIPSVNLLGLVAQNDDRSDGFLLTYYSRVAFPVSTGVNYYIAVDGVNDGAGYISDGWMVMTYSLVPAPMLRFSRSAQTLLINWDGAATLESTPALGATWTTLTGAPPVSVPIGSASNRFFRAVRP